MQFNPSSMFSDEGVEQKIVLEYRLLMDKQQKNHFTCNVAQSVEADRKHERCSRRAYHSISNFAK